MKAIILAAGRGERMRPLTDHTPKPLLEVGGKTLLEHHLAALGGANITDVVINIAWLKSKIVDRLGDGTRFGLNIRYSDEGDSALETGGGIFRALPLLGTEPFWVVNGDVYADCTFHKLELGPTVLAHLVMVPNPPHNARGDFSLTSGQISNTGKELLTYSGIAVLRPELFRGCVDGIFPLAPLLRKAADQGAVTGELLEQGWYDVGTPQRLMELDQQLSG